MFFKRKSDNLITTFSLDIIYNLKCPSSISFLWNFGSILGVLLIFQILSGLFLSFHFAPSSFAFPNIDFIMRDMESGWVLRYLHANGASFFFLFMYLHMMRGIFYMSAKMAHVWLIGCSIFLISILTAFLGYVLPWGQMSFWAATVITNLVSAIPVIGQTIVEWLWGGYSVGIPTLNRFFSLHFLLPFVLLALMFLHVIFLHETFSNNPLGIKSVSDYLDFHPFFSKKDTMGVLIFALGFFFISFYSPCMFMDVENFINSNPLKTPLHIKPEWYFLPFYAVLRAVPNKLGGVVLMLMVIVFLYAMPLSKGKKNLIYLSLLFFSFVLLFWIGGNPVMYPFDTLGMYLVGWFFFLAILFFF